MYPERITGKPIPKRQVLDSSKPGVIADDTFESDENGRTSQNG